MIESDSMDVMVRVTYIGGPDDGDSEEVTHDQIIKMMKSGPIKATVWFEESKSQILSNGQYHLRKVSKDEYQYWWRHEDLKGKK